MIITFIAITILFTITVGAFVGLLVGCHCEKHPAIKGIIVAFAVGLVMAGINYLECKIEQEKWNNGYCECGNAWEFCNGDDERFGSTNYYWKCDECGSIIELNNIYDKKPLTNKD